MTLRLRPLATLTIVIAQHTRMDGLPSHARLIGEAATCELVGDRVRASQAGGSSDWLTLHADGSVSVDARLLLATPAGHRVTVTYRGRAESLPATGAPVFITPNFETDDPELLWLNHVQAVGKGVRAAPLWSMSCTNSSEPRVGRRIFVDGAPRPSGPGDARLWCRDRQSWS